jgi:hypothetical protein
MWTIQDTTISMNKSMTTTEDKCTAAENMDTSNGNDEKPKSGEDNEQFEAMQRSFESNLNTGKIPDLSNGQNR